MRLWASDVFLGHFGIALAAKKATPKTSLGTLFFAAQFADMLWPFLLLLGIEQVRIAPGITRVTPLDFVSYPYSHRLAAQLIWGAAFGLVYFAIRREARGAAILAACVPSHWLLDYLTHRPDMPLFPGSARYGLGLWNSLPGTLAAELAIHGAGIVLYLSATRTQDRTGAYALWALLILLFVLYLASTFGPPPPSEQVPTMSAIAVWMTVPWAAWADRHRAAV